MSTEVKVLDAIATKDARVAGLEKEIAALRTCIIDCGSELSRLEKERDEAYNAGMRAVLDKQR